MTAYAHRLRTWFARISRVVAGLGPYAAIGLLLPGGSIAALLLWLYRHRAGYVLRK
jgi:hypothetical protein